MDVGSSGFLVTSKRRRELTNQGRLFRGWARQRKRFTEWALWQNPHPSTGSKALVLKKTCWIANRVVQRARVLTGRCAWRSRLRIHAGLAAVSSSLSAPCSVLAEAPLCNKQVIYDVQLKSQQYFKTPRADVLWHSVHCDAPHQIRTFNKSVVITHR